MTRTWKVALGVIVVLVLALVALAMNLNGQVGGSDEELPYNLTTDTHAIGPDDFYVTSSEERLATRDERSTGCHHRRRTVWLRMLGTDRLYWRFWQDTYWCTGFGTVKRSHRFTADHWSNGAVDNLWEFKQMYDPVRSQKWVGNPPRLMFKSTARGKCQWCVTRLGCIRTIEPWVKSRVVPNIKPDGYYYATGGG